MNTPKKLLTIAALVIAFVLVLVEVSLADVPTNNAIQSIMDTYRNTAANWSPVLEGYATRIFWILALIDIVWMGIMLALNPGEFADFTANLVRKVIFIGFFLALLQNGTTWAGAIVRSLVQAGGAANTQAGGTPNVTPALIFDTGFTLCAQIFQQLSVWSPADSLALVIGGIIIMICFALIAAMMLLIYVQGYIIIYAGVIFLGFGGSMFTKDITLKYLQAALAVGAKLFVMILVVGLGQTILSQWTVNFTVTLPQITLFIGAAIILLALVKAVPDMVGDMINGFSWGSGESLTRTSMQMGKMAVGAGVGAAAGAIGGTMAVSEAAKLASASGSGSMASTIKGTVSNLAKAGAQDVAGRLAGQNRGLGTRGGRMSALLKEQRLTSTGGNKHEDIKDEPYYSSAPDLTKTGSIYKDEEA